MSKMDLKATSKFIFSSIFVGIILGITGFAMANLFRNGITFLNELETDLLEGVPKFYFYFITLSIAALLVHFIKSKLIDTGFHGIADSIYFAHKSKECTDVKTGVLSTLAAFVSASGGASVGQYGPLVHFGTTFGSFLRRVLRVQLSNDLFIGAGVAASISAGFGAPLAGVLFAHEVILRHYSHRSILAISTASGVAYTATQFIWQKSLVFNFPQHEFDLSALIIISLLSAPVYGVIAILYMRSLLFFGKLSKKTSAKPFYNACIGVLTLSVIGSIFPEVMGLGTQTVQNIFEVQYGFGILLLILFGKIVTTSISLNFGFFGGVFSPSLLVGASAGAAVSTFLMHAGVISNFEFPLVICGMAAVTGSVIGAPMTMIVLIIELTGSYVYGLAALVSLSLSVGYTQIRFGTSYFDVQLDHRGINIKNGRLGLYLNETSVLKFCQTNHQIIYSTDTVQKAKEVMFANKCAELIVISESNKFAGKIDAISILNAEPSSQLDHYIDINCIRIDDTASVGDAMEIASDFVGEIIPIWNRRQNVVVGVISENAIFSAYLDEQRKITEMEKQ
jgi:CIC family chloride channel protein